MKRKLFAAALTGSALVTLAAVSGCGSDSWPTGDSVEIGVKSDQPGTGFMGDYPPRSGFDIKVAQVAADALGKKPDFKSVPSEDRQTDLDEKHPTVDLVVATYSINNERLKGSNGLPAHDFAGPYAITYQGFLVKKGGPPIKRADYFKGRPVCAWQGTTSYETLKQGVPGVNAMSKPTAKQCIEELESGRVDAVSTDQLLLYGFTHVHRDLEVVKSVTVGDAQYYGVGIPRGHRGACNKIKDALKKYVNSTGWSQDFKTELPDATAIAAEPNWEVDFKPTDAQIDTYSCRDGV
ncbi:transporter substrate-binding domain-containing protein [Streptomyces sp. NBC_01267]|uniref:transporter substrate-binding domain-containing protein n=1 Tax=unclassified Streptomyces TaxID=2593676 RepID=UPI002024FDCE|nr:MULTISPECIES: transporter substrate-binding domain-containing protein [unclassified Streptomyces]MCX4549898.1 transporter substrate-binding domain-containing protein [Streptomyces sp. NBC_01500]WSC21420.1 transporter substrate-binding domain-containing protein [Streptomyces sp. NBC_01766]WSV55350.1 transporter substrate-binding domain-containing protein [Streptomyces sp. NBC_01014]